MDEKNTEVKTIGIEDIKIPECCKTGDPDCPHVVRPLPKPKANVGL